MCHTSVKHDYYCNNKPVQFRNHHTNYEWTDCKNPGFAPNTEYRVKQRSPCSSYRVKHECKPQSGCANRIRTLRLALDEFFQYGGTGDTLDLALEIDDFYRKYNSLKEEDLT